MCQKHGDCPRLNGFTLVEFLVVLSIVVLLISILLPSLKDARAAAQGAGCLSHLRGVGTAVQVYASEYGGYLPGPNTSGYELTRTHALNAGQNRSAAAVQNMDWVSPCLGEEMGLSADPAERLVEILNSELLCPGNKVEYDGEYVGWGIFPTEPIRYSSYSAALGFHVVHDYQARRFQAGEGSEYKFELISYKHVFEKVTPFLQAPPSYQPRLSRVGPGARKIFAMDGARYVDLDKDVVSYNAWPRQEEGGNFMLMGPAAAIAGDPFVLGGNLKASAGNYEYGYRHKGKMNAVYFDGHCGGLAVRESLDISLYVPPGTTVLDAGATQDPRDVNGRL